MNRLQEQSKTPEHLNFLNNHPAINGISENFLSAGCFWVTKASATGEDVNDPITIYKTDVKEYERFKHKFKRGDDRLYVSYEEFYGKPWTLDHVTYGADINFKLFVGSFKKKFSEYDYKKWQNYSGFTIYGRSFDDMVALSRIKTSERFGNFDIWSDDMLTKGEIANNKKERPFFFKKTDLCKQKGSREMITNPKHLHVTTAILNRRWLKWFITTDYCKKTWGSEFDGIIKKTPAWVFDMTLR